MYSTKYYKEVNRNSVVLPSIHPYLEIYFEFTSIEPFFFVKLEFE